MAGFFAINLIGIILLSVNFVCQENVYGFVSKVIFNNENQNGVFGGFGFGENNNGIENTSFFGETQQNNNSENASTNNVFGSFETQQPGNNNESI